jgi:hypothetical protein
VPTRIETIEHLDARKVWPSEATDMTPWIASPDGLSHLNATTGLSLSDGKTEVSVGPFHADVLANLNGSEDELAVVENQLGPTDHDHLGKLLTYVHGLNGKVGIWIAQEALPEHRRVVEWLNRMVPVEPTFWLLEVDPIRIGGSGVGVYLRTVVAPERRIQGSASSEKPWRIDGVAYHHDAETSWPENVVLLDELTKSLSAFADLSIRWNQQLYLKVLNVAATKELRIFDSAKMARLDLAFMHSDIPTVEGFLKTEGLSMKVEPRHNWAPDSPWIGFDSSVAGLNASKVAAAIHSWLAAP